MAGTNLPASLENYINEKIAIGLIRKVNYTSTDTPLCGAVLYGVTKQMWERVLEPEIRRLVDVEQVNEYPGYTVVWYAIKKSS